MSNGPGRNMRGAGNPGGQPVMFTLADAERIGRAVGQVETGRRGRIGSSLPRAPVAGGAQAAKFIGAWAKGYTKQVVMAADSAATATATNVHLNIAPHTAGIERMCVIAPGISPYDGQQTFLLLSVECQS